MRRRGGAGRVRWLAGAGMLAVPLAEAGHTLAYLARYGPHGLALESQGPHAYLPGTLKLLGAVLGFLLLASLLLVALGRLAAGRGACLRRSGGHPLGELLLVLAAVQLDVYVVQEVGETLLAGRPLTLATLAGILVWGAAGQLPVAAAAAIALRWLSVRLSAGLHGVRTLWQETVAVRPPLVAPPAMSRRGGEPALPPAAAGAGRLLAERGPPIVPLFA